MKTQFRWAAAAIAAAILGTGAPLSAADAKKTTTIQVGACVDGHDELIIQGGNLVWRNVDMDPVGVPRHDCPTNATTIETFAGHQAPSAAISWIPTYSGSGASYSSGATSSLSPTFDPGLPDRDMTVSISEANQSYAQGYIYVVQNPSGDNGYQLVIDIINVGSKASMYTVTIVATEN